MWTALLVKYWMSTVFKVRRKHAEQCSEISLVTSLRTKYSAGEHPYMGGGGGALVSFVVHS